MDFLGVLSNHYNAFLTGAGMTALVSAVSIAAGMVLGLWLSFGLISRNRLIRRASVAYRSVWRGTPILVQLLIVFYLLPAIGLDVPSIAAAMIALAMNTAAFQAEIFRGGLLSIPFGQVEAARMLGIGALAVKVRILIPQMMRLVLPALINETISILKNSSLISVIAVTELIRTSQHVVSVTYRPLEAYTIAAVIYLAMNLVLARAGAFFEGRHARRRGAPAGPGITVSFDVDLVVRYGPLLLSGLWTTVYICALATLLAVAAGLAVSLLYSLPFRPLKLLCRTYIEVMRGTPILVLLFILYYGGPSIGLTLDAEPVGVLGLGLYGGGYFAEIFRAGFQSIPPGQIEAARMLGIPRRMIVARIQIPQMLTLIIPPSTNQAIILVKESAILSIITVAELTKNTTQMVNETFAVIEPYVAVALLYWLFIEGIAFAGGSLERRFSRSS